jgi:hypothetical protein
MITRVRNQKSRRKGQILNTPPHDLIDWSAARLTGALYLAIAVLGALSVGFIPSQIFVVGNPETTANNLASSEGLLRIGLVAGAAVVVLEIVLSVTLFAIFRHVSLILALIALVSRTAMAVIMGLNLFLWCAPSILVADGLGFEKTETEELVYAFFAAHSLIVYVWQIFFSLHLFSLGLIAVSSKAVPTLLSWGLVIGSCGYMLQSLIELSGFENQGLDLIAIALLVVVSLAEITLGIWFLIWSPRTSSIAPSRK